MRSYDPDIEDQIDDGRVDRFQAVMFALDEGNFGFFSGGVGTITWGLIDFIGAGSLISIERPSEDLAQTQESYEVVVASTYEVDGQRYELFEEGVLEGIENLTYYRRPAIIGKFYIAEDGSVIDFVQDARCEIHSIVHEYDDNGLVLRGILNNVGVLRTQVDAVRRNKTFQKQIDSSDKGLNLLGVVRSEKIDWGAESTDKAKKPLLEKKSK